MNGNWHKKSFLVNFKKTLNGDEIADFNYTFNLNEMNYDLETNRLNNFYLAYFNSTVDNYKLSIKLFAAEENSTSTINLINPELQNLTMPDSAKVLKKIREPIFLCSANSNQSFFNLEVIMENNSSGVKDIDMSFFILVKRENEKITLI